jgi:modulator of FtsH protease HflK
MAWNPNVYQGGNGGAPPDVDEVVCHLKERYGKNAGRKLLMLLAGLLVVVGLLTSYAQVEPDEVGVVLRLGR